MTQDHGIIICASLKFSFSTWEDRIAPMCQIPSCRAGCSNKKEPDWAVGAQVPAQSLSPTSCVTSKKSLLGTSVSSFITREFYTKGSVRPLNYDISGFEQFIIWEQLQKKKELGSINFNSS